MTEKTHDVYLTVPQQRDMEPHQTQTHPLVAAAMAHGQMDPATLRELLQLQREWEAGEAKRAYAQALVSLKRDLPSVLARDRKVSFSGTNYTHTSLAYAVEAILPHLIKHGFSHTWIPASDRGVVRVTCRLTHAMGHSEESTIEAPPDDKGSKSKAQGVASTITLLERYTLLAILGIATSDMKEPEGVGKDSVDTRSNLRTVGWIVRNGYSVDDVCAWVGGRKEDAWTVADVDTIRRRIKAERAEKGSDE